jgi:uncharacterized protein YbjT (DUF2867 family)
MSTSRSTPPQLESRSVLLCGATGLVGRECLRLLLEDQAFGRVMVLTRRPLPESQLTAGAPSKLQQQVVDFDRLGDRPDAFRADQVICTLGTTIKAAGSRERFRQVDLGYPLRIAELALERGARHFLLVSSMGANARSPFFYARVKGELEDALAALPYRAVTMVRPSLLLGDRGQFRLGEEIGKRLAFLVPAAYKPVAGRAVAAALARCARQDLPGTRIVSSGEIRATADRYFADPARRADMTGGMPGGER